MTPALYTTVSMAALFWRLFHKLFPNFGKKKKFFQLSQIPKYCIPVLLLHVQYFGFGADHAHNEQTITSSSLHRVRFWDQSFFCVTSLWLPAKCRVSYLISLEPQPHQVTMDTIHSNKVKQLRSPFHHHFSIIIQIIWKYYLPSMIQTAIMWSLQNFHMTWQQNNFD